jgi:hypothetical protein
MKWLLPKFSESFGFEPFIYGFKFISNHFKIFEIRLVSFANKIGLDFLLIVLEKSFV